MLRVAMSSVLVEVYGCSANVADAEIASGLLNEAGFKIVNNFEVADAVVLLTCVVKTPTERKITKRIQWIARQEKPLVVAGCMPNTLRSRIEEVAPKASLIGTEDLVKIPEAVQIALEKKRVVFIEGSSVERCLMPRLRRSSVIHIEPISSGCLGNCAYCIVKFARGKLHSYPYDRIIENVKSALTDGCKEIWVTAEDTACYESNEINLPKLLLKLSEIPGKFKIRVGMMTPNYAKLIEDELISAFREEKIFKFLHVPVQSGSDEVLKRMRRRYSKDDFCSIVNRFRQEIPGLTICTDIICGFPGETEEQFHESLELVKWLQPDMLNISRFWVRPGTEAETIKPQIPGRVIKKRSTELNTLWKKLNYESTFHWVGWEGEILIDEHGYKETIVGRNYAYKAIALDAQLELGSYVQVKAVKADQGFLLGKII